MEGERYKKERVGEGRSLGKGFEQVLLDGYADAHCMRCTHFSIEAFVLCSREDWGKGLKQPDGNFTTEWDTD
jgi:hypothetical protein